MSTPGGFGFPHEVLTAVLEHLPQDDLRNASQVSRDFYCAAHDAGLVLHHTELTIGGNMLETLADIVQHAESRPHLFKLGLSLRVYSSSRDQSDTLAGWDDALKTVRRALPFLVTLNVLVEARIIHAVYAALDARVPHLREFGIGTFGGLAPFIDIPAALFGGAAPRLRRVELSGAALPHTAASIPAFRGVHTLKVGAYVPGQEVAVARFCPAVRRLALVVRIDRDDGPLRVDVAGLGLESLVVHNDLEVSLVYTAPLAVRPLSQYETALFPEIAQWHRSPDGLAYVWH